MNSMLTRLSRLQQRVFDDMKYYEGDPAPVSAEFETEMAKKDVVYGVAFGLVGIMGVCTRLGIETPFDRAKRGDVLHFLSNSKRQIISYGWSTKTKYFWISEVGLYLLPRGRIVLYDFHTPLEHRRMGYHSLLLSAVFADLTPGRPALIFALSDNLPPHRVYKKLGLRQLDIVRLLVNRDLRLFKGFGVDPLRIE